MPYRMVPVREDYSDVASGKVLRSAPGHPAFPVRLAEELFLRGASYLPARPLRVWDPCCGSGYLVTVIGLLRRQSVASVLASDINQDAVHIATANIRLLTDNGLRQRREELAALAEKYQKPGYAEAARAAQRLARRLREGGGDLVARTGVANVFSLEELRSLLADQPQDLVLADVPYGHQVSWQSVPSGCDPVAELLNNLARALPSHAVIALVAESRKLSSGPGMPTLERFRIGNRAALICRAGQLVST